MRPLIRPFTALRPRPEHAAAVAAPPYDVLSSEEARVRAAANVSTRTTIVLSTPFENRPLAAPAD